MVSEQLSAYIRDNTRAGFTRPDIEAALKAAGWSEVDVAAAFTEIEHPSSTATPISAPASSGVDPEVARIQAELQRATAQKPAYRQAPPTSGESGITGWMMRTGLVSSKNQANIGLIIVALICGGLALWITFH